MNINVIVVNLPRDFRPTDASNHGRESDERFARAFSTPDAVTHGPISGVASIDEVIDLIPQNGAWVGKAGMVSTRTDSSRLTGGRKALYSSPTVATYNHEGKVHYSSQDKGLRINITA